MAKQIINTGTTPNSGTGDPLRSAFTKINENFTELYNRSVFSGSYNDLTNKPVLFSGSYNDLTNKPVVFNGDYNNLTNKPTLFSGSYADLTNKPTIPTNTNQLVNGSNYITLADLPVASAPYNQSLNTTDDVTFDNITVTNVGGIINATGQRITNTYYNGTLLVGGNLTQTPVSILMGGAGPRNEWKFTPDSNLTLPDTGKISVVGVTAVDLANLETTYNDNEFMYQDALSAWMTAASFKPVWFPLEGRLAYNEIPGWTLPAGVLPLPSNLSPLTHACRNSYNEWQEAVAKSKLSIKSDTVSLEFDSTGKMKLPQGGVVSGGDLAAVQAAYADWQSEEASWLNVITTGGADTNIRPWHFAGPSPEEKLAVLTAMWNAQQIGTIDWVPIFTPQYAEVRAWLAVTANSDGYRLWKKLTTGVTITSEDKSWSFTNDGAVTFPDGTVQTTAYVKTTGTWTVTPGVSTYSFTVPLNGVYQLWVRGNVPNGIMSYIATAHVTNSNVPVLGTQHAWNYTGAGEPIVLTSLPTQFIGTEGTISTANPAVGTSSNTFVFGIDNNTAGNITVEYGYTKIS